jgi:UDP-N-acetylglucosamine--N-acetylmuramyl-(pentapeptide) pyrophosphoryl-undecaprenol N-acetylglucosamine transferase
VYPALAVAGTLHAGRADEPQIAYIGSADGMEASLVARESVLPFRAVPAAAVRGRGPLALARNSATLARGTVAALRLIRRERPAAILGTGGYVCVPVFVAARLMGVPSAIYLPDIVPGLAVRFLARLATAVACSAPDSQRYFPQRRLVVTGYPARGELFALDRARCRAAFELSDELPTLLVFGGSRGARSINRAIEALLPHLLPIAHVIHVCGREGDADFLEAAAARLPAELRRRYKLFPYLHSAPGSSSVAGPAMTDALGAADLAVCRSGASILGELPAARLPALLVPYPYVHQEENADYLVRHGSAIKINDDVMLGNGLPEEGPLFASVRRLLIDAQVRAAMAEQMGSLARPDAARRLADLLLALAARRDPV